MPIWSIKIVPSTSQIADEPVAFVPDLPGAKPGDSLKVLAGDLVSWNNTTNNPLQPWPTDQNFVKLTPAQVGPSGSPNYLADVIPANGSSRPSWTAAPLTVFPNDNTIHYCCNEYPKVHGTIVIT
jgi:hypothetical protein